MSTRLVIIPTYNEKENVALIIQAVFDLPLPFHILIVDDGSPDGTGQIVKDLQAKQEGLFLMERAGKMGLGTAYIAGFRWGLERGYDYIFEMDADFSHNPKDLIRLFQACAEEGADLAVGSRYVKGGGVSNWGWYRLALSYGASLYTRMVTWMWVMDPTAGFVCYKREVLETIDLDKIRFIGYAFQIEMKYAAHSLGFNIKEVPITFIDRVLGTSKMHGGIISEAALGVLQIRWYNLFQSYRQKEAPKSA